MRNANEDLLDAIALAQAKLDSARVEERDRRETRDSLIRAARIRGISLRAIGEAASLHHTAVIKIERGATR